MRIDINKALLTPMISDREIGFVLYCFDKEYRGNTRKVSHRVTEMTKEEWQAARDMLAEHDRMKAFRQ